MPNQSEKIIPLTNLLQSVLSECIEASGKNQKEIAERLGTSPSKLSDLLHGRRPLSVEMSYRLSLLFGTSSRYWLNMQMDQQLRELVQEKGVMISAKVKPLTLALAD